MWMKAASIMFQVLSSRVWPLLLCKNDLPEFTTFYVGEESFYYTNALNLVDLPKLKTLVLDSQAFQYSKSITLSSTSTFPFVNGSS